MSSPPSHADSDRLAELFYDRLRELAERYMKRERRGHTLRFGALQPSARNVLESTP